MSLAFEGYKHSSFEQFEISKVPSLFQGIGQVIVASLNEKKICGVQQWVHSYNIFRGSDELPVRGVEVHGDEPKWDDAIRVSRHKVGAVVRQIAGEYGPEALVVGMDTVHFRKDTPRYNMSRIHRLTGEDIGKEIESAVEDYSQPTVVEWDSAITVSRSGLLASTGNRVVALISPIPKQLIYEHVFGHVSECKGYNAVIPVIDHPDFLPYIVSLGIFPLANFVDSRTGELREHTVKYAEGLVDAKSTDGIKLLDEARQAVVGGVPQLKMLKQLEELSARQGPTKWVIR